MGKIKLSMSSLIRRHPGTSHPGTSKGMHKTEAMNKKPAAKQAIKPKKLMSVPERMKAKRAALAKTNAKKHKKHLTERQRIRRNRRHKEWLKRKKFLIPIDPKKYFMHFYTEDSFVKEPVIEFTPDATQYTISFSYIRRLRKNERLSHKYKYHIGAKTYNAIISAEDAEKCEGQRAFLYKSRPNEKANYVTLVALIKKIEPATEDDIKTFKQTEIKKFAKLNEDETMTLSLHNTFIARRLKFQKDKLKYIAEYNKKYEAKRARLDAEKKRAAEKKE